MSEPWREPLRVLAELWRSERAATQERFLETRRRLSLRERVARGLALADLSIDETDAAPGGRLLLWLSTGSPAAGGELQLGPGDPVRLWWESPDEEGAVLGVVARRRRERLGVMVDADLPERFEDPGFRLDLDAPQATFERGARALRRLRDAPGKSDLARLRGVLYGGRAPELGETPTPTFFDAALNGPQQAAVAHAMAALDVALIHGPPGTGKTRTLVEVVRQAVARGESVLATAASNTAVDNLAERLAEAGVGVVRLGHPARVAPALQARTLDHLLSLEPAAALVRQWLAEANAIRRQVANRWARGQLRRQERWARLAEANQLSRDARRHLVATQNAVIDRASALCATAAGADVALLGDRIFDLVVLDEATQAVDPVALVALTRGRRLVLAGDPHQLPPTVIDPKAERAGLGVTCFERLYARAHREAVRMLVVQHRMNETLMAFPSASKYEGRLEAAPAVAHHRLEELPGVAADPLRPGPLVLVDTAGKGWEEVRSEDDPSCANPEQAWRVVAEVRRLVGRGVGPEDVAVITPYAAQARLLRAHLGPEVERGLEVGTVDGFQGREKEAVVVDLVRSNDESRIGFLEDTRRMNVALTRARRFLLVVGDSATIGSHPYYRAFLDGVEARGDWISAWVDEAPPFGE
jgi:ATP-dependent RNA/DNA helicase IGHMBP2